MRPLPLVLLALGACQPPDDTAVRADPPEVQPATWESFSIDDSSEAIVCAGSTNPTAEVTAVRLGQTHLMEPGWPFFFLVGGRPALLQVALTGEGPAPDVQLVATAADGSVVETCLAGPEVLSTVGPLDPSDADGHFEWTLPAELVHDALSLQLTVGDTVLDYGPEDLQVGFDNELDLLVFDLDLLTYDEAAEPLEIDANFGPALIESLPTQRLWMATFPTPIPVPTMAVGGGGQAEGEPPLIVQQRLCHSTDDTDCLSTELVNEMDLSAQSLNLLDALMRALGRQHTAVGFGHTGNLFPGGWGGGRTFVSGDLTDVTIHELGHALSLPHWGDAFGLSKPKEHLYNYPWGGENFDGGGRGPSWSYEQLGDARLSHRCEDPHNGNLGLERSDAMQRNQSCRGYGAMGPARWDGFSDFSALAMYRYMTGAPEVRTGEVEDPVWGAVPYQLIPQSGFPIHRRGTDDSHSFDWDPDVEPVESHSYDFQTPEVWDAPSYLVYGTFHPDHGDANVLYEPVAYQGPRPTVLDPTDPTTFERLASGPNGTYGFHFYWNNDLTLRITYVDGTILHALYPHGASGSARDWSYGHGPWRSDLVSFAVAVPADQAIARVEAFDRPLSIRWPEDEVPGNLANPSYGITAGTWLDGATRVVVVEVNPVVADAEE